MLGIGFGNSPAQDHEFLRNEALVLHTGYGIRSGFGRMPGRENSGNVAFPLSVVGFGSDDCKGSGTIELAGKELRPIRALGFDDKKEDGSLVDTSRFQPISHEFGYEFRHLPERHSAFELRVELKLDLGED